MLVAAASVVLFPSLAGAHHNDVAGTATCTSSDGTYTVTWTVENSEDKSEHVTLSSTGGGTLTHEFLDLGFKETGTVTQAGIPGTATTASSTADGKWSTGETNPATGYVTFDGERCEKAVTPAEPTLTQADCTGPGTFTPPTYTIAATTGVSYFVDGAETPADTYP